MFSQHYKNFQKDICKLFDQRRLGEKLTHSLAEKLDKRCEDFLNSPLTTEEDKSHFNQWLSDSRIEFAIGTEPTKKG